MSLKVPNIEKILLYEMKFIVPNYGCLQDPWRGGYRPQIPVLSVLCPQLNLLNPPLPNKIPGYATDEMIIIIIIIIIYCNCGVTRWQWLFYMYTKHEIGYY